MVTTLNFISSDSSESIVWNYDLLPCNEAFWNNSWIGGEDLIEGQGNARFSVGTSDCRDCVARPDLVFEPREIVISPNVSLWRGYLNDLTDLQASRIKIRIGRQEIFEIDLKPGSDRGYRVTSLDHII